MRTNNSVNDTKDLENRSVSIYVLTELLKSAGGHALYRKGTQVQAAQAPPVRELGWQRHHH